jgi:hypothetical protein
MICDHMDLPDPDSAEVGVFTRDDRVSLGEIGDYLITTPNRGRGSL